MFPASLFRFFNVMEAGRDAGLVAFAVTTLWIVVAALSRPDLWKTHRAVALCIAVPSGICFALIYFELFRQAGLAEAEMFPALGVFYCEVLFLMVVGNILNVCIFSRGRFASQLVLIGAAVPASLLAGIVLNSYMVEPTLDLAQTLALLTTAIVGFGALLGLPMAQTENAAKDWANSGASIPDPTPRENKETTQASNHLPAVIENSVPVPSIPSSSPPTALRLKLRRSQRSSVMGKVIFALDARMELSGEETHLVQKYRLGSDLIYDSANREKYSQAAQAHLEMTRGGPSLTDSASAQMLGAGKTLYRIARGGISAAAASLSLRVTIDSLIRGVHVECKSLSELLEAETAIVEAAQNLKSYLETARTFDGREEIIEL
jgi:hypothetical protein